MCTWALELDGEDVAVQFHVPDHAGIVDVVPKGLGDLDCFLGDLLGVVGDTATASILDRHPCNPTLFLSQSSSSSIFSNFFLDVPNLHFLSCYSRTPFFFVSTFLPLFSLYLSSDLGLWFPPLTSSNVRRSGEETYCIVNSSFDSSFATAGTARLLQWRKQYYLMSPCSNR